MYLERSPWEVAVAISPVSHPSVPPTLFPTSADDLIYLGIYMATPGHHLGLVHNARKTHLVPPHHPSDAQESTRLFLLLGFYPVLLRSRIPNRPLTVS